ncbi:MAG: response regulator [Sphingopyxis sp.]
MSTEHPLVLPIEPAATARIAIVEDDPIVRQYFLRIISMESRYDIVGVAPDIRTGRSLIGLKPDLFLLDIGLPDGSGYDLVQPIKEGCGAKALVISSFGDRDTVVRAISAGADGYLLKDSAPSIILEGIGVTLDGGSPISPSAAVYLLDHLRATPPAGMGAGMGGAGAVMGGADAPGASEDRLTDREIDLLSAFATGKSYKEAARTLGISPHTVGNHVKSIYRKLEVHSRSEAVREARRGGELRG